MNPFYVVRHLGSKFTPAPLVPWERESWSSNSKRYVGDEKKPDVAIAAPRRRGEPVLFLLGGGAMYKEELAEMAERIREQNRVNEPRKDLLDNIRQAFEDRMEQHRRNPVTDPAPNYTQTQRKLY